MPIAVLFDCSTADPAVYDRMFELCPELEHQEARLHHTCVTSGTGFLVIDVWESEDAFARFGEVLGPVLEKVDLHPVPDVHGVIRLIPGSQQ